MMFYEKFFPQLSGKWAEVSFNDVALGFRHVLEPIATKGEGGNPLLHPEVCERLGKFLRKQMGVDYDWGGFLEDRSVLWEGHYMAPGAAIHLGVDLNGIPVGTEVHLPVDSKLVHSVLDHDQNGGWGGKLIFNYYGDRYLVLGHLRHIASNIGMVYKAGDVIGEIAETEKNGGWSPHLHVQCMRAFDPDVDGYGRIADTVSIIGPNFYHPALEFCSSD